MSQEVIIVSLGGSIIIPGKIDFNFLKKFRVLILKYLKQGKKFFIVTGGGSTARHYQQSASKVISLTKNDLDWLGIHGTKINAHLLRTIFRQQAYPKIITNPTKAKTNIKTPIVIASGWKPGWSTDFVAVKLAQTYKAKTILNLSNLSFVCDKDPKKFKDAKPIKKINWQNFRKLVGNKWDPGLNLPFDPIASMLAEKLNLTVVILKGTDIKNLDSFLNNKIFKGTVITNQLSIINYQLTITNY
ncbi:UMP kinase [Patescibacteria group bacterium]|nr:UMP kinase [Patescibacteria group bacterium]